MKATELTPAQLPILYSFRRCPYAMRTRMTLWHAGLACELREVSLRNKPEEMLAASPKGTVPVLIDTDGTVFDESLDIMRWALKRNDPEQWLQPETGDAAEMFQLITLFDDRFKIHLDRYKYASRYAAENNGLGVDSLEHRQQALDLVANNLAPRLEKQTYLFGSKLTIADVAISPFMRQFANTEPHWFADNVNQDVQNWLSRFLQLAIFEQSMKKYDLWQSGGVGVRFST
ncbi:MAG: glutathione S-transferase N-terminal domain-containing protein [Burkholderiaceae bacterium]